MTNPFAGFQWKHYLILALAMAGGGLVTGITDELAKCQTGFCHIIAPAATAALTAFGVYLHAIQQNPPAPYTGPDRRADPAPEAK